MVGLIWHEEKSWRPSIIDRALVVAATAPPVKRHLFHQPQSDRLRLSIKGSAKGALVTRFIVVLRMTGIGSFQPSPCVPLEVDGATITSAVAQHRRGDAPAR